MKHISQCPVQGIFPRMFIGVDQSLCQLFNLTWQDEVPEHFSDKCLVNLAAISLDALSKN